MDLADYTHLPAAALTALPNIFKPLVSAVQCAGWDQRLILTLRCPLCNQSKPCRLHGHYKRVWAEEDWIGNTSDVSHYAKTSEARSIMLAWGR